MKSAHRRARSLADEFRVPLLCYHSAGMDWLIWLYPPAEIIVRARSDPAMVHALLDRINAAYTRRLEVLLDLGVDGVCRRAGRIRGLVEPAGFPRVRARAARRGYPHDPCRRLPVIYLMDTGVVPLLGELGTLDFDCLFGVDPAVRPMDLPDVRKALPGKSLWGGISSTFHLGRGTPAETELAVEQAFESCGRVGFLLGPLEAIRHDWPWDNILACDRAWRRLRKA